MQTRATLLLRLKSDGPSREVAWEEFCRLYSPIIARFARARGVQADHVDELVQDVVAGFFAAQPRFQYDPSKGRFREYLMACVSNAVRTRLRREQDRPHRLAPDHGLEAGEAVDWDAAWRSAALEAAVCRLREHYGDNPTFQAFEAVVLRGQPADSVAQALGLSRESVYQAKSRLLAKLRVELDSVEHSLDGGEG